MPRVATALALLVTASAPATAHGQGAARALPPLPRGEYVRLRLTRDAVASRRWRPDAARWRGELRQSTPDSLQVALRDGRSYTFAWTEVDRLEWRSRMETGYEASGRGAVQGGLIGAVAFGVVYTAVDTRDRRCELVSCTSREETVTSRVLIGASVGALLGIVFAGEPQEVWERVDPRPSSRVVLLVAPRRAGLAIATR